MWPTIIQKDETGREWPIGEFRQAYIQYLADNMPHKSDKTLLLEKFNSLCSTLGRNVRLELGKNKMVEGEAIAINEEFGLVIKNKWGQIQAYNSGDVVHLTPINDD